MFFEVFFTAIFIIGIPATVSNKVLELYMKLYGKIFG